ncbi:rhodanese [Tistrella bauzanensis]|uniref:Rhodanese n=1 Tax=Tistrella bauzanensis TaxID=657419 RepID=A0ABQ1IJ79_9PROT|nr:rhodanese-like domain-containing protein [Tistrella bauzanensis]GGB43485.1 rhodanese [Tistrella bauzanensis]
MPLKRTVKDLVMEASARIRTIPMDEAETLLDDPETLFVDIRDVRELDREGMIPGAYHAPRGMLEFWVDPESPYHKPVFASGKSFVLYCGGAWRSALATAALQDMGLEPVAHMEGGFTAWKAAGRPVVPRPAKS